MNYTIPLSATIFPPNLGPDFEAYQSKVVDANKSQIASANSNAASIYATACANWTAANLHGRDMGLPLTPKPVAPASQVAAADTVAAGDTIQFLDDNGKASGAPITVSTLAGTLFLWDAPTGAPVGPPCPDLPAVANTTPGHVHIGVRLGSSYYWQKCADDTYPLTGPPVHTTSDDGMTATFVPIPSGMFTMSNPYSGYWQLVSA